MKNFINIFFTAIILSSSANIIAANYCGELKNSIGPFDYREKKENEEALMLVESRHFNDKFERLIEDERGYIGGELAYTLRAFPNHHRALMAFGKLALKKKTQHPFGSAYSVECFFDRAMRFRPDDGIVRLVYGIYLSQAGNTEKAIEQLIAADKLEPDNSNINYNLGLLYFKKNNYESAIKYAKNAYRLGFSLPWLKDALIKSGKWDGQLEQ
jgi:tetratricopeptide (TPR) repeat protein